MPENRELLDRVMVAAILAEGSGFIYTAEALLNFGFAASAAAETRLSRAAVLVRPRESDRQVLR